MKISLPVYVVGLVVGFVYALLKYYFPQLPLTEELIGLIINGILALLGIDVVNALRKQGLV